MRPLDVRVPFGSDQGMAAASASDAPSSHRRCMSAVYMPAPTPVPEPHALPYPAPSVRALAALYGLCCAPHPCYPLCITPLLLRPVLYTSQFGDVASHSTFCQW